MQFSSHLLNVFLGNFVLYFLMYLINKVRSRRRDRDIVTPCEPSENALFLSLSLIEADQPREVPRNHDCQSDSRHIGMGGRLILLSLRDQALGRK